MRPAMLPEIRYFKFFHRPNSDFFCARVLLDQHGYIALTPLFSFVAVTLFCALCRNLIFGSVLEASNCFEFSVDIYTLKLVGSLLCYNLWSIS